MTTVSLDYGGRQIEGCAEALRSRAYYDKKFAVTKRFQIEEMVHQDQSGVVFRSWDTERQRPVAVRRFFLEKKVNEALSKKIGGQSLFSKGLERLKSLEVGRLRRVVGGGLDEVDNTPFLVTDWWDGRSCSEYAKELGLTSVERRLLEEHARELLKSLPSDLVDMVSFHPNDVVLERVRNNEVVFSFWICPHRFFRMLVGETSLTRKGELTQDQEWAKLVGLFPDEPTPNPVSKTVTVGTKAPKHILSRESTQLAPVTKLKSAESGKRGWMVVAAMLALILLVAGFIVFFESGGEEEIEEAGAKVVEKGAPPSILPPATVNARVVEPPVEIIEEPELEVVSAQAVEEVEEAVEAFAPGWESIAGSADEGVPEGYEVIAAEDEIPEVVDSLTELGAEGEVVSVAQPANKVMVQESAGEEGIFSPNQIEVLRGLDGEAITLKGTVSATPASGGKGSLWYLDFGDYRDEAYVVFKHGQAETSVSKEEWDELNGEEVLVFGTVEIGGGAFNSRGSNVRVRIDEMSDVRPIRKVVKEAAAMIYSPLRVDELKELVGQQQEIKVRGVLSRFVERDGWRYLVFQEGTSVCARFSSNAPFARDPGFLGWLRSLRGKKVEVRGMVRGNPIPNVDIAIEFDAPDAVAGTSGVD